MSVQFPKPFRDLSPMMYYPIVPGIWVVIYPRGQSLWSDPHMHHWRASPGVHTQHSEITFLSSLFSMVSLLLSCSWRHPFLVIWAWCLGFSFPAQSYSLLYDSLETNRRQTIGDSTHVLRTMVSLVREKGSPPVGFQVLHHQSWCTRQDCQGTDRHGNEPKQGGGECGRETIIKKGVSSIFCLVGDPFPNP